MRAIMDAGIHAENRDMDMVMRSLALWATMAALVLAAGPAASREVGGVAVPETARLADGTELVLNGAGLRTKFFFRIYAGALYLRRPLHEAAAVLADPGPKRVLMRFIYKKVTRDKLAAAWEDGFRANLDEAAYAALAPRLARFNALFPDLGEGDEVRLDYLPGEGTQIWIDGRLAGTIPGADFHRALLAVWLGESPADWGLKEAMLGTGDGD